MSANDPTIPRKKVAIVGSGSAGIATLWALNRTHHDVYLYEAAARLGGHTNTVSFKNGKYTTQVDTGFIVMNAETYRMLCPSPAVVGDSLAWPTSVTSEFDLGANTAGFIVQQTFSHFSTRSAWPPRPR